MISSQTAQLAQGPIRYRESGEGDPIVFVHGLLVNGRLWDGVAERLSASHRCIVPDWPMGSHTMAMKPDADLSPPGLANVIVDFLDALELERATIVGNDTGGAVSQILAADHPERVERLVLTNCDTFEHFPPSFFKALPPIARIPGAFTALTVPFRIGAWRRATYAPLAKRRIDPELVDSWVAPGARDSGVRRDARKVTASVHKRYTLEAAEKLRGFERPVLLAWGTEDRFFKLSHAQRLAAVLPDARIVEIPEAGTFVPLDAPERVAEAVASFTAEPAPASSAAGS